MTVNLFGEGVFAAVIKLRILRCDRSLSPGWALNAMTSILTRDREEDTDPQGAEETV